jgi:hypothetical protein
MDRDRQTDRQTDRQQQPQNPPLARLELEVLDLDSRAVTIRIVAKRGEVTYDTTRVLTFDLIQERMLDELRLPLLRITHYLTKLRKDVTK